MEANAEKIAQLKQVLDAFASGEKASDLFDTQHEQALAPVRKRALLLLDQRARSRHELRERLIKAEFEPALVDEVLDALAASKLLDDTAFANEWVRQRFARRGKAPMALDRELKQKGIVESDRRAALEQITQQDQRETAYQLAEKKVRSIRQMPASKSEYDKYLRRVLGVLARRGFASGLSMSVAKEVLDGHLADLSATED